MSEDPVTIKRNTIILVLCLAGAAVAVVVVLAVGMFILIPLFYPAQAPQAKMATILTEPPPPPPPPPPISSSPQAPAKIISGHSASQSSAHSRIVLSSGVAQSLLIQKSPPMYPPIARAARVSGAVVLHAVISASGSVINLQVISGPPMLQQSALDAVKNWKYRPYLLNNEPVEFETTINVIFILGD
jgi:protein TonB